MKALTTALCCLLFSAAVFASWGDIPDGVKTELITRSYNGDAQLTIRMMYATRSTMTALYESKDGAPISDDELNGIFAELDRLWPSQPAVLVGVIPNGTQYFWPWKLAFTQGNMQYDVESGDYAHMTQSFNAGQLREGTVAIGFVAIPERLDITQSFRIWYDDEYTVMPPLP